MAEPRGSRALDLDAEQNRVVEHGPGVLRVLGGPGTGKTTVLEERFVRLALSDAGSPDRILFLVPNRAQKIALQDQLTTRLLVDEGLEALIEVPVYTWHGLANHLVNRHYRKLGYEEPPVLLTSPEQWGDIGDALKAEDPVNWPHYKGLLRSPSFADEVVDFCIRAGQHALGGEELARLVEAKPEYGEIVRFYRKQSRRLRQTSRIDYPTLLAEATSLLADRIDVRLGLHERFRHVLVDDGQELSLVQRRMLRYLAGTDEASDGRSLVVAADPDSAIEAFRGADPGWLERFEAELGSGNEVTLATSYRLGPEAGKRAVAFVSKSGSPGAPPSDFAGSTSLELRRFSNLAAEVEAVGRELRLAHLEEGIAYEDMAILLTSPSAMLPPLERVLAQVEVPFSISAPDRPLIREPAVRSFRNLALFALTDDEGELNDLLRSPLAGLADRQIRELERLARERDAPLGGLIGSPPDDLDPAIGARLRHLLVLRDLVRSRREDRADAVFWAVWEASEYYRGLEAQAQSSPSDPANRDLDALVAFDRALRRFVERRHGKGSLGDYLDALGRADFGADPWLPPERARGGVNVLSFHAAKGKQWKVVSVCGCVEGAIPKGRRARGLFDPYFIDATGPVERARANEAEDRRVFYVAITRASERCIVTTSPGPSRRGQPSRFLEELNGGPLEFDTRDEAMPPLTFSEAAARYRRTVADLEAPAAERLAALGGLAEICKLDPTCTTAMPEEWWWRWEWTQGALPIRAQSRRSDDDLPADKLRTSYSRISKYDNCGLQYLLSTVLGLDPDTSHNMAFGTWLHQIFEDCEKEPTDEQKASGRRRLTTRAAVEERYEELFEESVFPNKAIANQFHRDGQVMIDRYIRLMNPGGATVAEHQFKVDFNGHRIDGRIDRVDLKGSDGLVVSDYKTSRYPVWYEEARRSLQLAIYYLAANSDPAITRHGKPIKMQLVYPAHMSRGEVTVRHQTPEQAEEALERLPGLIEGVLAEDFRPSPEADCMWCKFKPLCPLWSEGKELPP